MLLLAVDTSGPQGSVAIFRGEVLLGEEDFEAQLNHSEVVLPAVDRLMSAAGLRIGDVEAYAVAAGPGSFTGIRIGLATVKALAFASGRPVAPVSSLAALALRLRTAEEGARFLCPMIDAKKGEIYASLFEGDRRGMTELIPQGAYLPESFLSRLPRTGPVHFIGSGVELCRAPLLKDLKNMANFSAASLFIAREVGQLGRAMFSEGGGVPSREVRPLYFRRSQAEEKH